MPKDKKTKRPAPAPALAAVPALAPSPSPPTDTPQRNVWGRLQDAGIGWYDILEAMWKERSGDKNTPKPGAKLYIQFADNTVEVEEIQALQPDQFPPAPPQTLGLSPITCLDTPPKEATPEAPSFHTYELLSEEPIPEKATPTTSTRKTTSPERKRTKRTRKNPSVPVEEQAAAPAPETPTPTPAPTPDSTPAPAPSRPRNQTKTQRTSRPPLRTTQGIVIHGVALRKDLEKVREWLEEDNKELGKMTTGIRWLRRKTTLEEEGKKASSIVLYTKARVEIGRVRLGGKWLRSEKYEPNR